MKVASWMKFSNAQVGGISNNCVVRIVISVASTSTTPVPKAAVIFISVPGLNVPDFALQAGGLADDLL